MNQPDPNDPKVKSACDRSHAAFHAVLRGGGSLANAVEAANVILADQGLAPLVVTLVAKGDDGDHAGRALEAYEATRNVASYVAAAAEAGDSLAALARDTLADLNRDLAHLDDAEALVPFLTLVQFAYRAGKSAHEANGAGNPPNLN